MRRRVTVMRRRVTVMRRERCTRGVGQGSVPRCSRARVVHHPGYTCCTCTPEDRLVYSYCSRGWEEGRHRAQGRSWAWVSLPGRTTLPRLVTVLRGRVTGSLGAGRTESGINQIATGCIEPYTGLSSINAEKPGIVHEHYARARTPQEYHRFTTFADLAQAPPANSQDSHFATTSDHLLELE